MSGFCTALPAAPRAAPVAGEVASSVKAASAHLAAAAAAWLIPASVETTASVGLPRSMAHVARGASAVPGNYISSQVGSSCQGNRYGMEMAGGTARPSRTKSLLPGHSPPCQPGGPPCWAGPLAFGLIDEHCTLKHTHMPHLTHSEYAKNLMML